MIFADTSDWELGYYDEADKYPFIEISKYILRYRNEETLPTRFKILMESKDNVTPSTYIIPIFKSKYEIRLEFETQGLAYVKRI